MSDQEIVCPNCGHVIPVSEALENTLREKLKAEVNVLLDKEREELNNRKKLLDDREKDLVIEQTSHDKLVADQVAREVEKIKESLRVETREEFETSIADLKQQIEGKDKKLSDLKSRELELLRKKQELEEARRDAELEIARKMDVERTSIEKTVSERFEGQYGLKIREKDKQISDLKKQFDEMQRKLEQGSQQLQGEVFELQLEDFLRSSFPRDTVEPVPKGFEGADVLQRVFSDSGQICGTIIWESKRTKNWSDSWTAKLKDDQLAANAEVAVILTVALPKGVQNFEMRDGVWITDYLSLPALATALRYGLVQVASARFADVGKNEKIELLYQYLTGQEFRRRIEAIVETFVSMKTQLDQEKRAFTKNWKIREKQIDRVVTNTSALYGEIQSIAGSSVFEIPSLELPALPDVADESDQDENDLPF
jgi:hypothetical protein